MAQGCRSQSFYLAVDSRKHHRLLVEARHRAVATTIVTIIAVEDHLEHIGPHQWVAVVHHAIVHDHPVEGSEVAEAAEEVGAALATGLVHTQGLEAGPHVVVQHDHPTAGRVPGLPQDVGMAEETRRRGEVAEEEAALVAALEEDEAQVTAHTEVEAHETAAGAEIAGRAVVISTNEVKNKQAHGLILLWQL